MIRNYLKLALRNIFKNRVFVLINILGLGVALACCIVAYLNWEYNAAFDTYHKNADQIYRVNFVRLSGDTPIKNGSSPLPIGKNIATRIAEVDQVVRYYPTGGSFKLEGTMFGTNVSAVDPSFFETFTIELLAGDAGAIHDKRSIYISEDLQIKHFPGQDPLGKILTYINGEKRIEFQVAGVFKKPPLNSSFVADAYFHFDNVLDIEAFSEDNWAIFDNTFVRINDPADVAVVEQQLEQFVQIQNEAKPDYKVDRYYLDPFAGMAVRAESEDVWNHWTNDSLPTAAALTPAIMALLLLLLACFNFTNTSIAIANRRIKEIGIRKVMGSGRKQLIGQFLGENMLLAGLAVLLGILLAFFLVPAYSAMWVFLDIRLNFFEQPDLVVFILLLWLFTGLVAGSYPALYVSSFRPASILRGSVKFSGTNWLTRVLLTLQYGISLIAIICGFVFANNAKFQEEYDLGFDPHGVLFAHVKDEQGYQALKNQLQDYDAIEAVAGSRHNLTYSWYTDPIKVASSELDVSIFDVGSGYLSTVGATLVSGRDFRPNSEVDRARSVIVNEELVKTLGWDDPLNQRIVLRDTIQLSVVGVVQDIYFMGALWNPLRPMLMRCATPGDYRYLSVRTPQERAKEVKALMDEKWANVFPNELSTVRFMDTESTQSAEVNANIKTLFLFLGVVACILSAIGLFSLVSLNLNKRMKEIGVRKILGASVSHLAAKMSKEFILILVMSFAIGSVGGHFLSSMLLDSIWAYSVPTDPTVFLISIFLLLFISTLTIGGKIFRAASVVPAEIIRDE